MDSGSEITAKIRSAIKAKLVELGAYVDDELPDYIMVMIANKKTKEQMRDDLNLFLGKNSNIFTEWVHGVLDRLQAISQQKTVTSTKDKTSSDVAVAKKPSDAAVKKPAVSSWSQQISEKLPEKRSSTTSKENKPKQIGDKRSSKKSHDIKTEDQTSSSTKTIGAGDEDVLEMHPVIAGDELDEEITGKSKDLSSGVYKQLSSSSQRKRIEAPSSSSRNRNRPSKRRTPSPDERDSLSRKRRSVVGHVVHRESKDYDDNEEYDPTQPQLGSVVKVSQRKYKVPVTMQPKPSIFLKALNEANASVSRRRDSPPRKRTRSPEYVSKPTLFSSNNRRNYVKTEVNDDKETADFCDVEMASDEEYVPEHPKFALPPPAVIASVGGQRRDTRRVEYSEPPLPGTTTTVDESGEELIVDTTQTNTSVKPIRFVVTLDGVSSSFVKKVKDKEDAAVVSSTMQNGSTKVSVAVDSNNDIDDQDTLIVGVDEDQLEEQMTNQVNEVKICLDDDEDDDEPPTRNSSVVATIGDTQSSDDGDKVLERCKYWPVCKLGSSCQFIHPTVPCKTFPNCRFGDRCVYIHPNCRYDSFCTNQHCVYVHSNQRRLAPMVQASIIPKSVTKTVTPLCKFGNRCFNVHCPFKHMKPCIYGLSCSRMDCTFTHPIQSSRPSSPLTNAHDVKKFRWVAPTAKNEANVAVAAE